MRKTSMTLVLMMAVAGCGTEPSPTVKFRGSIGDPTASPARSLLLGLDDVEHRYWFDEMAVAGNFLYFNLPWHGVYRMPKYGGDVSPIEEANGVEDFRGVAANDTDVFWAKESAFGSVGDDFPYTRLRRQALVGGPIATVAEGGFVIGDEFNGTRMFYANSDAVYGALTRPREESYDLTRFPVDRSAPSDSLFHFDLALPNPGQYTMVTDEAFAYVLECGNATGATCSLVRIDLLTSRSDALATFGGNPTVAAVDATNLYVTNGLQLLRLPKLPGGEPVVLATFPPDVFLGRQVVVDEANVFVTSSGNTLWAVPKEGGAPRALATGFPKGIDSLAQDEKNIFVLYGYDTIDIVPKAASLADPNP